jgi:alkyldihydroxyacetonephosphate synthase
MRRWNGWGDETIHATIDEGARGFLEQALGLGAPPQDASLAAALAQLPA